jgi:hypothetical protein
MLITIAVGYTPDTPRKLESMVRNPEMFSRTTYRRQPTSNRSQALRVESSIMSGLVKRYKKIPVTLYRLQGHLPVMLRDKATQLAAGRASYDLSRRDDGLVHPASGTTFTGPNGMSLRPATETMLAISKQFRGNATVYRLSEGLELPSGLVVLHERDDHFSLQTDEPITLETLNERLTNLLVQCPTQTLQQFIAQLEDVNDQDN